MMKRAFALFFRAGGSALREPRQVKVGEGGASRLGGEVGEANGGGGMGVVGDPDCAVSINSLHEHEMPVHWIGIRMFALHDEDGTGQRG